MPSPGWLSVQKIKKMIPRPLYPLAKSTYDTVLNNIYAIKLFSLKLKIKSQYSKSFKFDIHPEDEMYRYIHEAKGMVPNQARMRYFSIGKEVLEDLENILKEVKFSVTSKKRILEFASGYGKVTRFLVSHYEPKSITVSDISQEAVDFNIQTFQTNGFFSVSNPKDLDHNNKYDLIIVISLFSHLPQKSCEAWLCKLYDLLEKNGLLIFTTHGMSILESLPTEMRQNDVVQVADGFYYREANETFGRLHPKEYGTTYISERYIRHIIDVHCLGRLRAFFQRGMSSYQDTYVIQKHATTE